MHNRKNSDCWRFALQLVLSMVVGTHYTSDYRVRVDLCQLKEMRQGD